MFAKEIFDYPELEEHPQLSNHLGIYNSSYKRFYTRETIRSKDFTIG